MEQEKHMESITDMKFYTTKEVAKLLRVTSRTVRNYCEDGLIKGVKTGRSWLVSENNLRAFINGEQQ